MQEQAGVGRISSLSSCSPSPLVATFLLLFHRSMFLPFVCSNNHLRGRVFRGLLRIFSQKYGWRYNLFLAIAEREKREWKGDLLPGVAASFPSIAPADSSSLLSEMNKSLCLSDTDDVIIKAASQGPPPSPSRCLILLSDLLCDLL